MELSGVPVGRSLELGRLEGPMPTDSIVISGAREHNLKNISLTLPRDKLIVITGLSGSGSRRSRSTRSTPKGSAATSSR
jgi:excinuclease ABC subunit A